MIILIAGASHTGKTMLSKKILDKYRYPYLSIDHLKMGLIRSGYTDLSPSSGDEALTDYLWPVVREMIKTAIENNQNMTVEGCYIPYRWQDDFSDDYLKSIRYIRLIMSEKYIREHFDDIKKYACVVEKRLDDSYCTTESVLADNRRELEMCNKYGVDYYLIDDKYEIKLEIDV